MAEERSGTMPGPRSEERRLAEEALQAEREGDTETADRLFTEADRRDPQAVQDILQESNADRASHAAHESDVKIAQQQERLRGEFEIVLTVNEAVHRLTVDARRAMIGRSIRWA